MSDVPYQELFEQAMDMIAVLDREGCFVDVNPAGLRRLGYERDELVGRPLAVVLAPEEQEAAVARLARKVDGSEAAALHELVLLAKDGCRVPTEVRSQVIARDEAGSFGVLVIARDVSEQLAARAALEESEQRFRGAFDGVAVGMTFTDPAGTLLKVNAAFAEMLGYSPSELIGVPVGELVHPDERAVFAEGIEKLRVERRGFVADRRYLRKDGETVFAHLSVSAVRGADGSTRFLAAQVEDVTGRVELEDQLRQAQKMEAVGRLAGGIAHDFNNLLLTIRGYAELALEKLAGRDDNSAEIGAVMAAAEKAAGLTAQLLAFSRQQVLSSETFDLRDPVAEMVKLLRRLIPENVELAAVLADEPTLIHADRTQIEQVIANLAVNAGDAMPDGGRLSLEVARTVDQRQALLVVRDDGTGMDALTVAQIFEPFFTTKGQEGTGLGLSMVAGIISQSGGQIAVESEPGQGTTFTISLPLADGVDAPPEPVAAAPAVGGVGGSETILLVEDEPVVREVVTSMLEQRGYRLVTAGSGEEALALARATPGTVDLLITDLMMGGLNGRETAEAVCEHQPQAKVLYMSGYTDDAVIRVSGPESRISFLQKPFSGDELARRVREVLDTNEA